MFKLKVSNEVPYSQEEARELQALTVSSFISKLFYFQTATKFLHLKVTGTGSSAAHLAIGDLYDTLSAICDSLTETAQTEEILSLTHEKINSSEVTKDIITELSTFVDSNRYVFSQSFQQNMIDNLTEKIALTKYKLKFLS